jgi:hypothetical protein
MPAIKNGLIWADYVRNVFIPSLELYRRVVVEKVLPCLSNDVITEETHQVEREAFERMGNAVSPEDYDPGDFAQPAFDKGLEFYQLMHDTRQGLVNGLAAALYHLFEQQLCAFYRLMAWDKKAILTGRDAEEKLRALGLDVAEFPEWASLDELRLLANCVKHAEGSSSKQLADLRPDLFGRTSIGPALTGSRPFVERPLSGEGLYFSATEFDTMVGRLKRFWVYVAEEIGE